MKNYCIRIIGLLTLSAALLSSCSLEYRQRHNHDHDRDRDHNHNRDHDHDRDHDIRDHYYRNYNK